MLKLYVADLNLIFFVDYACRNDHRKGQTGDSGKPRDRQWESKPNFSQQRSKSGFNNSAGSGRRPKSDQAIGAGPGADTRSFGGRKRELDGQSMQQYSNSGPSGRQGRQQQQQHHQPFGERQTNVSDADRDASRPQATKPRVSVFDRLGPRVNDGSGFGEQQHPGSGGTFQGGFRQNEGVRQFTSAQRRDREPQHDSFDGSSARSQQAQRFNRGGGRGGGHMDRQSDFDAPHKVRPLFGSMSSPGSGERDSNRQAGGGRDGFDFSNAGNKQTEDFHFGRMDNVPPRFQKNYPPIFLAASGDRGDQGDYQNRRSDDFKRRKHVPHDFNTNQGSNDGSSRHVQNKGANLLVKVKNTKSQGGAEPTFAENVVEQVELEGGGNNVNNAANRKFDVNADLGSNNWMGEKTFRPSFGVHDQQNNQYGREYNRGGRGGGYRGSYRGQGRGGYRNQRHADSRLYSNIRPRREDSALTPSAAETGSASDQPRPSDDWSAVDNQNVSNSAAGASAANAPKQQRVSKQPSRNAASSAEDAAANDNKSSINARDQRKSYDEDDDSEEAMARFIEENTLRLDVQLENLTLLDSSVTSPESSILKTPVGHEKIIDWAAAVEHDSAKFS
jgi:hypothetical protein